VTLDKPLLQQFLSFAGVGIVATGLQYGVLIVAVEWLHMNAVLGSCSGFVLSATLNYWLNYHFTFRSQKSHAVAGSRFSLVAVAGLSLNAAAMALLVEWLKWPYVLAQLVTTALVLLWTFCGNRVWSFAVDSCEPRKTSIEGQK
jgi:putative flippase GtrA